MKHTTTTQNRRRQWPEGVLRKTSPTSSVPIDLTQGESTFPTALVRLAIGSSPQHNKRRRLMASSSPRQREEGGDQALLVHPKQVSTAGVAIAMNGIPQFSWTNERDKAAKLEEFRRKIGIDNDDFSLVPLDVLEDGRVQEHVVLHPQCLVIIKVGNRQGNREFSSNRRYNIAPIEQCENVKPIVFISRLKRVLDDVMNSLLPKNSKRITLIIREGEVHYFDEGTEVIVEYYRDLSLKIYRQKMNDDEGQAIQIGGSADIFVIRSSGISPQDNISNTEYLIRLLQENYDSLRCHMVSPSILDFIDAHLIIAKNTPNLQLLTR